MLVNRPDAFLPVNSVKRTLMAVLAKRNTKVLLVLLNVVSIAWPCLTTHPTSHLFDSRQVQSLSGAWLVIQFLPPYHHVILCSLLFSECISQSLILGCFPVVSQHIRSSLYRLLSLPHPIPSSLSLGSA